MAMKVYQSGDLVVLEKNAEPVININISVCTFRIQDNIVYVFDMSDPTIQNYDIVENIQDSLGAAIGNFAQVLAYLNAFILSGSAAPEILPLRGENFNRITMNFEQEDTSTSIMFKDPLSGNILTSHDINVIEAIANGTDIRIQLIGGHKILIDRLDLESIFIDTVLVTQVLATAVNELNGLFTNTGVSSNAPTITSSATIALTVGNSINFTPTGTDVVTWSYDSLPAGIVSVEGQHKTIIGGSLLPVGVYNIELRAVNYHGVALQTIVLTISSSYSNTYSYEGSSNSYMQKTAVGSENDTPLYRPTGATGPAWTIFSWMKSNSSSGAWKVVFHFGDYRSATGGTNGGAVYLLCRTYGGNIAFWFVYGDWLGNYVRSGQVFTGIAQNVWFSYQIVYDGTTTNNSLATLPFSMYLNGVAISPSWAYGGTGYAGSIEYMPLLSYPDRSQFNLGRGNVYSTTVYAPNVFFDEMALWQSDQSANAATFGAGSPIDLASYNPYAYYRFGDAATDISGFPVMEDTGTTGTDLTMFNGNVGLYVSDVP